MKRIFKNVIQKYSFCFLGVLGVLGGEKMQAKGRDDFAPAKPGELISKNTKNL